VLSLRHGLTRETSTPPVVVVGTRGLDAPEFVAVPLDEPRTTTMPRGGPSGHDQVPHASPPPLPGLPDEAIKPFEQQQLDFLQYNLFRFDGAQSIESARDVLWREAVVTLYDRGEYLTGPEAKIELDRPGYNTVSLESEHGHKLFYISEVEFPEYAEVLKLVRNPPASSPPLSDELVRRIKTRVIDTLWRFGVKVQE
jgi:hypothetical protein